MEDLKTENSDLAAALFFVLGESVPHRRSLEDKANQLKDEINDREKILLKVIELCGEAQTPKQLYLIAKAYSWLGKKYYEKTIEFAGQYLHTPGWNELPSRTKEENGITVNYAAAQRASILIDLGRAQEGLGRLESALFNFMEAYRLEPYSAMNAIKAADVVAKMHGREEALMFLCQQKESAYYDPAKYTDVFGNLHHNDVFKQLLDAHILKLQENKKTGW
jgi:tetratricopeptide (TPR) repeat protein